MNENTHILTTNLSQLIFESAAEGIVVVDATGKIALANDSLLNMFQYQKGEVVGNPIEILIPNAISKAHVEHRNSYIEDPQKRPMGIGMNLEGKKKNGVVFAVEVGLNHFELEKKMYVIAMITDISKRKKAEDELSELNKRLENKVEERTEELANAILELQHINQSMEREIERRKEAEAEVYKALQKERNLSEMKSRFVSMASHEFRTPLTSILSATNLLEKITTSQHEEKKNKYHKMIRSSVKHLTEILNDFLSIEKLQTGNEECSVSNFDLIDAIEAILSEIGDTRKSGQKITFQKPQETIPVTLDQNMVRNIFFNMLSNSIKYSAEGKEIIIRLKVEKESIQIEIQDFGIGIPVEEQKHLFEQFYRAKNAINIQGTGLGLHIVKHYVELMNGQITFKSEVQKGSTFYVTLPLKIA